MGFVKVIGRDCDVCFESDKLTIKCFGECSLFVCIKCISRIIFMSSGYIFYKCPQCRTQFKLGYDINFTNFVSRSKRCRSVISRLVDYYETDEDEFN